MDMTQTFSNRLIFYSFLVFMFLMRPFMVYQASNTGRFATDPDRVFSMFQRVGKKKENHADDTNEAADISKSKDAEAILPFVFLTLIRRQLSWILSLFADSKINWKRNTVFQVSPSNQYYQLISRLQL